MDGQAGVDEASIRSEVTEAVAMRGVMKLNDFWDRKRSDPALSNIDLVTELYVTMRRAIVNKLESQGGQG